MQIQPLPRYSGCGFQFKFVYQRNTVFAPTAVIPEFVCMTIAGPDTAATSAIEIIFKY